MRTLPYTIHHSGKSFTTYSLGPNGLPMWPNDEFFARHPVKPEVEARIRRLSGGFQEEGSLPRGYHPKVRGKRWLKKEL